MEPNQIHPFRLFVTTIPDKHEILTHGEWLECIGNMAVGLIDRSPLFDNFSAMEAVAAFGFEKLLATKLRYIFPNPRSAAERAHAPAVLRNIGSNHPYRSNN